MVRQPATTSTRAAAGALNKYRITDEGLGFNHNGKPDPTVPGGMCIPRGSGMLLMRGFMTTVQFNDRGNVVTMTKVRGTAS